MIKKIYLTHHTHMDIGYTDLPEEVMNQQRTFLDRAVGNAAVHRSTAGPLNPPIC